MVQNDPRILVMERYLRRESMYKIVAYHPGAGKYLIRRWDGVQFFCNLKMLNFMLRLGLIQ